MALPTTITGISTGIQIIGPFKSSAGNIYVIGRSTADTTKWRVMKATDPTSSFSQVGSDTGFGSSKALQYIAGYQVSDVIHIFSMAYTTVTSVDGGYITFNMSADTFGTGDSVGTSVDTSTQGGAGAPNCAIVVRSGGNPVVLVQTAKTANMGSSYSRVSWKEKSGGSWSAGSGTAVGSGGTADELVFAAALGASDRVHFGFDSGGNHNSRTLSSANVLSTAVNTQYTQRLLSYDDSGTTRVVGLGTNGTALGNTYFNSAEIPTTIRNDAIVTPSTVPVLLPQNQGTVYMVTGLAADSDLYVRLQVTMAPRLAAQRQS